MEHDMTEQKREPKDGERWWVKNTLTDSVFMTSYHTSRSDQFVNLAPVASHELARELVEALKDAQGGLDYIRSFHGELYGVGFDRCKTQTKAVLVKAKLAGLGE